MDNYSPSEFISNCFSFFRTKLFFRDYRFVRFPFYLRGRKSIDGAKGLTLGRFCRFELDGKKKTLRIGKMCEFGDMTHIVALESIDIGDFVLIASKCFISDSDHGSYKGSKQDSPNIPPNKRKLFSKPVIIGRNVWIGENTVILSGTEIADGCIVGANSVVRGIFNKTGIIAGNPAKYIKIYNYETRQWEKIKEF